jgi:hypothetical protein
LGILQKAIIDRSKHAEVRVRTIAQYLHTREHYRLAYSISYYFRAAVEVVDLFIGFVIMGGKAPELGDRRKGSD